MKKQVTIKNQVMDYLQWSSDEYEERFLLSYWNWCALQSKNELVVNSMLASASINKWFILEFKKLELAFLRIVEVVPNKTEDLRTHYKTCTANISKIYPGELVKIVKKLEIDFEDRKNYKNYIYN